MRRKRTGVFLDASRIHPVNHGGGLARRFDGKGAGELGARVRKWEGRRGLIDLGGIASE